MGIFDKPWNPDHELLKDLHSAKPPPDLHHVSISSGGSAATGGYVAGGGGGAGWAHQHIMKEELMRQISAAHTHAVSGASYPHTPTDIHSVSDRIAMIASRLRCHVDDFPFRKFASFVEGEKVHIFIVLPAGPTLLEDDAGLFPSDTLMTQLRLLLP